MVVLNSRALLFTPKISGMDICLGIISTISRHRNKGQRLNNHIMHGKPHGANSQSSLIVHYGEQWLSHCDGKLIGTK